VAGIAGFAAYVLVLAALERAPAAAVSAVRETSVVIATALAALVLHEPVGAARAVGAVAVVGGVALIALA
jgi:drug/metabolite transporter (DMT)-like permease